RPPSQGQSDSAPTEPQPRSRRVPGGARADGAGGPRDSAGARARSQTDAGRHASERSDAGATQGRRARVIVVDTNLLVYLYVSGANTGQAERVLVRDPVWVAPLLWRSEFRNVVAGLARRRALDLDDAVRMTHEAELRMAGGEYTVASQPVLPLAAGTGRPAQHRQVVVPSLGPHVRL